MKYPLNRTWSRLIISSFPANLRVIGYGLGLELRLGSGSGVEIEQCEDRVRNFRTIEPSDQWRYRQGGGVGAQCPLRDFQPGNVCRLIGKNEARKKSKEMENGKMEKKMRKNGKGKEENEKCKGKKRCKKLRTFLFLFSFLLLGNH